ncbi:class IV adenylate cyclase [Candidatus Woesearchaeota archaeon]|nr:class IV adenylate cyclase [Candidatus Woesearchaeota archaeon]
MPLEIEVKILEIDISETTQKLEQAGAMLTYDGPVITTYYDFPGRKEEGAVLRLRQKGEDTELTLKKKDRRKDQNFKIMEELEVKVSDGNMMDQILQGMNATPYRILRKHRRSYLLPREHVKFDIDKYDELPPFLEIEAEDTEIVQRWVKRLGYSMNDAKPWTTSDVFKHYGKRC